MIDKCDCFESLAGYKASSVLARVGSLRRQVAMLGKGLIKSQSLTSVIL